MSDVTVRLPPPAPTPASPPAPLTEAALGRLLGALASRPGPVPKYQYPSAGTLYPVQTYVVLRQALGALPPGTYCHDPDEHALVSLSAATPRAPDGSAPAAMLVLVARGAAITPIYGGHAQAFCLLEAGYMTQALADSADGLTLRDAGDPAADAALGAACALDEGHVPLVCLAVETDA